MAIVTRIPDAQTNPKFGKAPSERTWQELIHNGIVVIDKPAGPTSHQVSAYVQKILGITDKMNEAKGRVSEAEYNQLSVRLELQADFFAGVDAEFRRVGVTRDDNGQSLGVRHAGARVLGAPSRAPRRRRLKGRQGRRPEGDVVHSPAGALVVGGVDLERRHLSA